MFVFCLYHIIFRFLFVVIELFYIFEYILLLNMEWDKFDNLDNFFVSVHPKLLFFSFRFVSLWSNDATKWIVFWYFSDTITFNTRLWIVCLYVVLKLYYIV